jgi:hypothetical protein
MMFLIIHLSVYYFIFRSIDQRGLSAHQQNDKFLERDDVFLI